MDLLENNIAGGNFGYSDDNSMYSNCINMALVVVAIIIFGAIAYMGYKYFMVDHMIPGGPDYTSKLVQNSDTRLGHTASLAQVGRPTGTYTVAGSHMGSSVDGLIGYHAQNKNLQNHLLVN